MELIGYVLIGSVVILFIAYLKWSQREEKAMETEAGQKVTVLVKGAYSPNIIKAIVGKPLTILFDRQEDSDCSKKVIINDFNISVEIPDFGQKEITITPQAPGSYPFSCEMGMYQGKIEVE